MRGGRLHGRLVVLEGPDGVGKTTLAREVVRILEAGGLRAKAMSFPGAEPGTLGKLVYDIHHEPARFEVATVTPAARQTLHLAAHLDAIDRNIAPALREGTWVVLDRFWWSLGVYGAVSGIDMALLDALIAVESVAWGSCLPAIVFLLRRETPIERDDPLPQWRRLRSEYDRLGEREAERYPVEVIDNDGDIDSAVEKIGRALEGIRNVRGTRPTSSRKAQTQGKQLDMGFSSMASPSPASLAKPSDIAPLKPSPVYDTYWRFAAERQEIFFRRATAAPPPWTTDPILATYKFTNTYRASDRVSQYLIRHVIYRDDLPTSVVEVFFRIMLFKVFNKIETWELLESVLGSVTFEDFTFKRYDGVLTKAMAAGTAIYSAAYIMPSGGSLGHEKKHRNHLVLIERMVRDHLPQKIADAGSMQRGFELLRGYPTIGDFLAYQYVTDLNYSDMTTFSEMEFVVPGPGALDGLRKCFADTAGLPEAEIIRFMADRQEREFERLGLSFRTLFGRRLQLIDCQNIFCEVDKYARVRHPEIAGLSGRTKIKQRFSAHPKPLELWFPPKWKLNALVASAGPSRAGPASRSGSA